MPGPSFDRLDVGLRNWGSLHPIGSPGAFPIVQMSGFGPAKRALSLDLPGAYSFEGKTDAPQYKKPGFAFEFRSCLVAARVRSGSHPTAVPGSCLAAGCLRWLVCGRSSCCFATAGVSVSNSTTLAPRRARFRPGRETAVTAGFRHCSSETLFVKYENGVLDIVGAAFGVLAQMGIINCLLR